jgi:hypothetical protein
MKKINIIIFFIASVIIFCNTRYVTYDPNDPSIPLKSFMGEYVIWSLTESPAGLIFGGTGGSADGGKGILFYFDPELDLPYNPTSSIGGYPRALVTLSTLTIYTNIKAIEILSKNSTSDSILFIADINWNQPGNYGIFKMNYDEIYKDIPGYQKVDESPNNMKVIDAVTAGPPRTNKYPLIYISADDGSGTAMIEVFDPETMSFIDTMAKDIHSETGNRDYWFVSATSDSENVYFGSCCLTAAIPRILKLDKDNTLSELFLPESSFFGNDNHNFKMIFALKYYNGKIYGGTSSPSTEYGGRVFYYDLIEKKGVELGRATVNSETYKITDLVELNGEIYGGTHSTGKSSGYGNGRIFKIAADNTIYEEELTDYRITYKYYNPAIIQTLVTSHKINDVFFGTFLCVPYTYGGLIGAVDFYPPAPPKIRYIIKKGNKYYVYFTNTGDDAYDGNATYYELKGGFDSLEKDPDAVNDAEILATSTGNYFVIDNLFYPYFYISAYDNVHNRSIYSEAISHFIDLKIFPNPATIRTGVNFYLPVTTDKIEIYNSSGHLIDNRDFTISDTQNDEGYISYYWDLRIKYNDFQKGIKIASGIYFLAIYDVAGNTYTMKFAVVK